LSSSAWYSATRADFILAPVESIANQLAGRAVAENLEIERAQAVEWQQSVGSLQSTLKERLPIIREALSAKGSEEIHHVILEYDFRRRGLRLDCVLLGAGVLFIIEFKRTKVQRADLDQVMGYAVNLLEFHRVTRDWCAQCEGIVVPVVSLTVGRVTNTIKWPGLSGRSWPALANKPMICDRHSLNEALSLGLANRRSKKAVSPTDWLASPFGPSSSILDATLSLFGNHDVSAIHEHAAPRAAIDASLKEIIHHINGALERDAYHIIFLSGAPGAGKTLVGLEIVMRGDHRDGAVFVTGNAPLVDVLNAALEKSYNRQGANADVWAKTGYRRADARLVAAAANFKIVKAHNFLGNRGVTHRQEDGRVLVFDEAQRTYVRGHVVRGQALSDHEADLILDVQRKAYPVGGAVVVALVGHNQAINRGERGILAWLEAATKAGWSYSIADKTLELAEFEGREKWAMSEYRKTLEHGHLHQSMRYYRNDFVEKWVAAVLDGDSDSARSLMLKMETNGNAISITRSLVDARVWAKAQTVGDQRAGLIASGQARRLAAEGLFVDLKPDIVDWMLAPTTDIRSSNSLETVQNQYQIQGLELDYSVVCWDADLRREEHAWAAYKLSGATWKNDRLREVTKNSYRVLLTRARKGMVIFIPRGDTTHDDDTRKPAFYDGVYDFLVRCGAKHLAEGAQ
jgi:hypothetical protein